MPIKRDFSQYFKEVQAAEPTSSREKKSYKVENLFTPAKKDGKFSVVIRFLPSHPTEMKPFVENRMHMFKLDNDNWFVSDCLGKFGKPCPICEYNRDMFKKFGKEEGRTHSFGKARAKYYSNILVIRNPNAPDTEGKVFRLEYGPQIMHMISAAMTDHEDPESGMIKGFNPFDWHEGANFVYEGVDGSNGPKLDSSHFGPQKPINKWTGTSYVDLTDSEIDEIESKLYTLEDCYHKEEDCRDYNSMIEFFEKKAGRPLFEGGVSSTPSTSYKPAPKKEETAVSNDDFSSLLNETTETTSSSTVETNNEVDSEDDFFKKLAADED